MGSKKTLNRRDWLYAVTATIGGTAGCTTPLKNSSGTDSSSSSWRTFRANSRNTGFVPNETGPIDEPDEKWTVSTEGGVWGSPVIADGHVYIGSMDRTLYAIDAVTGEVDWTYETDGPIQSTPTVSDDRVYFGSFDKHVYCLDAETGKTQWTYETEGLVNSSPKVDGTTLYIGCGAIGVAEVHAFLDSTGLEQDGGGLYALDVETGEREWRRFSERLVSSTPAVVDGAVYIGLDSRGDQTPRISSLKASDGSIRWHHETDSGVITSPSMPSNTVYAASFAGTVYALAADTGDEEWTLDTGPGDIRGSTAVTDESVYVPVSGNRPEEENPVLYSLSLDGDMQWEHEINHARQMGGSPAVTSEAVYIGTHHHTDVGGMYAISHEGERLWSQALPWEEGVGSSAAVHDGTVYYGADHNTVYAME